MTSPSQLSAPDSAWSEMKPQPDPHSGTIADPERTEVLGGILSLISARDRTPSDAELELATLVARQP